MSAPFLLLLVDDDADDREIFLTALGRLEDKEIVCHTASNGPEALSRLSNGELTPGLIFLDMNMPMMNGQQVLQKLKGHEKLKDIPVIVLTTASDPYTRAEANKLGATQFYSKPNRMSEWSTMLQSALSSVRIAA
jgi:CheY-like chemotaxis protein